MGNLDKTIPIISLNRECGSCTKCCDGWLRGEIYGTEMRPGVPCHFRSDKGCDIYENRPETPCKTFKCEWLRNENVPGWLKPSLSNAIIKVDMAGDMKYLNVIECGTKLDSSVLNWAMEQLIGGVYQNISFTIDGERHYYGTEGFVTAARHKQSLMHDY